LEQSRNSEGGKQTIISHHIYKQAAFKPMQPMQLNRAPRHGVWADYHSFLPDTLFAHEFNKLGL